MSPNVASAWDALHRLDAAAWVGLSKFFSLPLAYGAVALGVVLVLAGSTRLFRAVAIPLGFLGAHITLTAVARFPVGLLASLPEVVGILLAVALASAGALWPKVSTAGSAGIVFFGVASLYVGRSDVWWLAFTPGLVGITLGMVLHRHVAAVLSSLLGAGPLALGVLRLAQEWAPDLATRAAAAPWLCVLSAGAVAFAGTIFQVVWIPSPEKAAVDKLKKVEARRLKRDKKDVESRWAQYSRKNPKRRD